MTSRHKHGKRITDKKGCNVQRWVYYGRMTEQVLMFCTSTEYTILEYGDLSLLTGGTRGLSAFNKYGVGSHHRRASNLTNGILERGATNNHSSVACGAELCI